MAKILLGTGVLTWSADERRSDRYGTVYLIEEGFNSLSRRSYRSLIGFETALELNCLTGELITKVKRSRDSTHIGDLFRGIFPSRPEVGEIIPLGSGDAFWERAPEGGFQVGLKPRDGRQDSWLDIPKLYRAHEQTVELWFERGARGIL